ncbi:hypothetical protein [Cesiribacter andamanensis]|uniref:Outer membrane protein beta-barrel domain-containing protein n=1 Tax=Cesiribacter andamanensis AMV16 TaxID=1279009 RepID=M7N2E1_9BACT|nr:hypothetical protein [Cesiribacter andamanensis]EMR02828.1 hypothetical protein ADICEAN_02036 [Cesiribacter andamanensis AMV16]
MPSTSALLSLLPAGLVFVVLSWCLPQQAQAQGSSPLSPGTRSVHLYGDVYKTDFENPWRKLQAGFEAAYHLNEKLMFTGGLEFWNAEPTPMVSIGNRFYPFGPAFIRYRALLGSRADVALGMGYSYRIGSRWQIEAASDYYVNEREIGFRLGVGYLWKNRGRD